MRLQAHPCSCCGYCLTLLSEVSRNKFQTQQPSFQRWGFARAKHQGPWCLLFLWCAPCWWLGSADRGIFAKVPRKFCEGRKPKCIAKGVAQHCKPCKKMPNKQQPVPRRDSAMLAARLQGYEEVIRDNLVWFGRRWMNLHKRSCCSTWVPQKTNMEFAKDSRTIVPRRMAVCR